MAAAKKRPGPPSLGDAALNRVLSIKISNEQLAAWSAAAEKAGVTIGEWIRRACERLVRPVR